MKMDDGTYRRELREACKENPEAVGRVASWEGGRSAMEAYLVSLRVEKLKSLVDRG